MRDAGHEVRGRSSVSAPDFLHIRGPGHSASARQLMCVPVIQQEGGRGFGLNKVSESSRKKKKRKKKVEWTEDVPEFWQINIARRPSSLLLFIGLRREHGSRTRCIERCHPAVLECIRVLDGMHPLDGAHLPELVLVIVPAASPPREAAFEPRDPIRPGAALSDG